MSDAPLFSVIVPTYARPAFVARAVQSVLGQSVASLECIVVDDGPNAEFELPDDDRVRVVRQPVNRGSAAARNAGVDQARGQFVAFLDDDDQYAPDRLELALQGLHQADIAVCWSRFEDAEARPGRKIDGHVADTILAGLVPNVGQVAVWRDRIPRFDEQLRTCEDVEWWIRAAQGLTVATVPKVGLIITRHPAPRYLKEPGDRARARIEILERYEEFFESRPRSAAFQWMRVGRSLLADGDRTGARRAFIRSFAIRPRARPVAHLLRSLRRARAPLDAHVGMEAR